MQVPSRPPEDAEKRGPVEARASKTEARRKPRGQTMKPDGSPQHFKPLKTNGLNSFQPQITK